MPTSHALPHAQHRADFARWAMVGFLAGAASVLVFHQGAVALFHQLGLTAREAYSVHPTRPWSVPVVWSLAFWGGIWGIVLSLALERLEGARLLVAALVFGAVLPTLVAWFVVAPLKGQPMGGGFAPAGVALALVANGLWGLGTGIGLALFGRHRETA